MFGCPFPTAAQVAREGRSLQQRTKRAVPWCEITKLEPELNVQADTYHVHDLFPELPAIRAVRPDAMTAGQAAASPNGAWRYAKLLLPAGSALAVFNGTVRGNVVFDGEIVIPTLWHDHWSEFPLKSEPRKRWWSDNPFMSLTPMEMLTLRPGTRLGRGHVVVGGLGLGYQLAQVCERQAVQRVTLVEKSQELVDWLWPKIAPLCRGKQVDVIVGDANVVIPKLTADVALIDIFPRFGGNEFKPVCPNIERVWCWGAAQVR